MKTKAKETPSFDAGVRKDCKPTKLILALVLDTTAESLGELKQTLADFEDTEIIYQRVSPHYLFITDEPPA
jgi:hypothetical protein